MHHKSLKISTSTGEFNCRVLGEGSKNIVAFHGFGQDGNAFLSMASSFTQFTIYSFDLPFHGKTKINGNCVLFSEENIVELMNELMVNRALSSFSVLAFSIGAKFAFPIISSFTDKIENIWLIAPDGISRNTWYQVATGSKITRHIFKTLSNNPGFLKRLTEGLLKLKIVNAENASLALGSFMSKSKSQQVYSTWIYVRKLKPKLKGLSNLLKNGEIRIKIFLGEKDLVIPKIDVERKCRDMDGFDIMPFPCTHKQLIKYFLKWLKEELN